MSECTEVNINGKKFVREDSLTTGAMRIVICDRGWVFVGRYKEADGIAEITNSSVVRRWGTTAGLGELAHKGPLSNTKLDKCPTVRVAVSNIVACIDCQEEKWI